MAIETGVRDARPIVGGEEKEWGRRERGWRVFGDDFTDKDRRHSTAWLRSIAVYPQFSVSMCDNRV